MRNCLKMFSVLLMAGLTAVACVGGASVKQQSLNFDAVQGKSWMLVEVKTDSGRVMLNRPALEANGMGDTYTLQIDAERISGKAAPNRYFAPYQVGEDQHISFKPIAGTLMISIIDIKADLTEQEYYDYLDQVYRWDVSDGNLELHTLTKDGKAAVLIFSRQ
ncbi:MAG: META domain-containing protein [Treponema sp.]|nr:META domain-containing protein [Treponema sp.]